MIVKPLFQKFRNSELVQFLNDALIICKQQNVAQLLLTSQVGDLEIKITGINAVFKITQGSSITVLLVNLDKRRDAPLIGIHKYAEGLLYHFDPTMQMASQAILDSFDKYGKRLYLLNYEAETSTVNSLLNDWKKDSKLAGAVVKLNLTDWANELETSNDLFNGTFISRVGEEATADDIKFVELRKSSILSFRELVKHIEARATIDAATSYKTLINSLNILIEKYNRLVSGRNGTDEKIDPPKA